MSGKFDSVKVVNSRTLYEKLGRTVVVDFLEFGDGSRHEWVYFKSSSAVAVAAFTRDNKMILTKQYRHPLARRFLICLLVPLTTVKQ